MMNDPFAVLEAAAKRSKAAEDGAIALSETRSLLVLDRTAQGAFFATLAMGLKPIQDFDIETACVDGKHLAYNPDWFVALGREERIGLLAHEVMHCANKHMSRRGVRDPRKWNIACVVGGTRILMADGTERPIEAIRPGDKIAGVQDGRLVSGDVEATIAKTTQETVSISSHGHYVVTSGDHAFLTEDGYVEARDLCAGADRPRCLVRVGSKVHQGQPREDDVGGVGNGFETELHVGSWIPGQERPFTHEKDGKASQRQGTTAAASGGGGVHRWNRGRGGNSHDCQNKEQGRCDLLSAVDHDFQHQHGVTGLVQGAWLPSEPGNERQTSAILENQLVRPQRRRSAGATVAVSDREEETRRVGETLRIPASQPDVQEQTERENGTRLFGGSTLEYAAYTAERQQLDRRVIVYDLSTTCHSFVANGFVVHNCDLAINQQLLKANYKLPEGGCIRGKGSFAKLKEGLSAEEYYSLLPDPPQQSGGGDNGDGEGGGGQGGDDPGGDGGVKDAGDGSAAAASESSAEWDVRVLQAAEVAKQRGKLPGSLEDLIGAIREPKVDWRAVLREFLTVQARNNYAWFPPNRRFIAAGLYLPGMRSEEIGDILVVVDTSGSCWDKLGEFASEIEGILQAYSCEVKILYHDAEVQHVHTWTATDGPFTLEPRGGGGTSHVPVFKYVDEQSWEPTCMVLLTDMYSEFPKQAPPYPTLWCSVAPCTAAPFGRLLMIE